ncbi:hypothetical protein WR25_24574 [Diploscapter pachys]|uniref:Uncharacterized protein n=1 Tax=Diploscapter pachys TaxID=2018661 RepID=A0A2A2LZH8_9BILA|nr:hypothetical protein WR25_24574 [Diploscapter pachys]
MRITLSSYFLILLNSACKVYANFTEYVDDDNNIFELLDSQISGKCSVEKKDSASLFAKYEEDQRVKELGFYFQTNEVKVKHGDELRWQLSKLVFKEHNKEDGLSIKFESDNSSIIMSAPLNQKYVCKDKINVTLHHEEYSNIIVTFSPEIDLQPYGPKSNCVIMGFAAIGSLIGHSVRRHFIPERKQIYESIVGT